MPELMSESITNLIPALIKAQEQFSPLLFNAENSFITKKNDNGKKALYTDLATIIKETTPILHLNGLCISQSSLPSQESRAYIRTTLFHVSGEWLASECLMPAGKGTAQDVGGSITYARRYCWTAILGITSEHDDDGNNISHDKKALKKPLVFLEDAKTAFNSCKTMAQLKFYWNDSNFDSHDSEEIKAACDVRIKELENEQQGAPEGITPQQSKCIQTCFTKMGFDRVQKLSELNTVLSPKKQIMSVSDLTKKQASSFIELIKES